MFVRYIAEREETQQGLLTLIPFIEGMKLTKKDAQLLNKIDCHIEKNLPYPLTYSPRLKPGGFWGRG